MAQRPQRDRTWFSRCSCCSCWCLDRANSALRESPRAPQFGRAPAQALRRSAAPQPSQPGNSVAPSSRRSCSRPGPSALRSGARSCAHARRCRVRQRGEGNGVGATRHCGSSIRVVGPEFVIRCRGAGRRQRRRRSSSSGSNQRSAHARAHVPSERKLQLQAFRGLPLRLLAPTLVARAAAPLRAPPRYQDRSRMFQLGTAVVEADGRTGGGDGRPRLRWRLLQRNRALMRLLQRGARIALGREGREGREGRSTPGKGLTRHRPARPRQSRPSLEPARSTVQAHAPTAS